MSVLTVRCGKSTCDFVWEGPLGVVDGMGSAVENALGALDVDAIVAQAANAVVTKHVTNLAKEALSDALTPERVATLQEREAAAVESAFEPPHVRGGVVDPPGACAKARVEACGFPAAPQRFEQRHGHRRRRGHGDGSVDEWLRKYWRFTYRRRVSAKGTGTDR
nr:hypothetical protein [Microbacterium sp. VKM Ac-2923]